jgi:ElaB/YqjD/DUF883 family membrane-anchored ribosome-binding protein
MIMGEKHAWRIQKEQAEATGDQVGAMVAQALEAMRRAVEEVTELLGENAVNASAALKEAGKAARAASDNLSGMADGARDFAGDARDFGRGKLGDLQTSVRKNPFAWVAAAAGVGLIVGLWRKKDQ